jgi:transcriptional regulator with XRE-family HTH domain
VVSTKIRQLRKGMNLTQEEFAGRLSCRREEVWRWERGKHQPQPVFEEKINRLLARLNRKRAGAAH